MVFFESKPERSSPDPIGPAISARMISVRLTFALVFDLISRDRRSRKSTGPGGRMTVSLFSADVPASLPAPRLPGI